MAIIAKNAGTEIEKLEDGVYNAHCVGIVDLGEQFSDKYQKGVHKIRIVWQIVGETYKNAEGVEVPRAYGKEYNLSLNEKSTLRKDLQSWRNKPFTDDELKGFDLSNILGKPCQIQLLTKPEKNYQDVVSVMACPKGTVLQAPEAVYTFDLTDEGTYPNFLGFSNFIQDKIKSATDFAGSQFEAWYNANVTTEEEATDTPF